jgi:hypothetical protein
LKEIAQISGALDQKVAVNSLLVVDRNVLGQVLLETFAISRSFF